jgi:hypothetical protein
MKEDGKILGEDEVKELEIHSDTEELKKELGISEIGKETLKNETIIVKFLQDFGEYKKDDIIKLPKEQAEEYLRLRFVEFLLDGCERVVVSGLAASHVGKDVIVYARVVGEITQLAIPKIVKCPICNNTLEIDPQTAIFSKDVVCKHETEKGDIKLYNIQLIEPNIIERIDYSILFVQNLLEQITGFDKRFYTKKKIHVIGIVPPNAKQIRIKGKVIVAPNKEICILATEVNPIETEIDSFVITEQDKENWIKYFRNNNHETLRNQIAPDMVGRSLVQDSILITLHSLPEIKDVNNKTIKGIIRGVFCGDTKCYKSESLKDITINYYRLGDYIVAESASRAGITYTIDTDARSIIWGVLVLNDLGFVAIDGFQRMYSDEVGELREALESGKIIVARSVSGEAFARTRIITAMNPFKPLNQSLFRCMSLRDNFVFKNEPDLTRWDFFIPFGTEDVDSELITGRVIAERPIPKDVFMRHVYWVWSRKADDIEYSAEARQLIIERSKEIIKKYSIASLPIVHNGFRDILTKASAAIAALRHSTDESHEKVIVRSEHVQEAVDFYYRMFEDLQLEDYKFAEEGKLKLTETEFTEIAKELGDREYQILDSIKMETKSSSVLAEELGVAIRTIKDSYAVLSRHNLVSTKQKIGVAITPRGITFLKILLKQGGISGNSAIVQKSCTIADHIVQKSCTIALKDDIPPSENAICEYCGRFTECQKVNGRYICQDCAKQEV